MPASTATLVLKNNTLRWSSPEIFNDPFDVPRDLSFGIPVESLLKAYAERIVDLINNAPADCSNISPALRRFIEMVAKSPSDEVKAEVLKSLAEAEKILEFLGGVLDDLRVMWRESLPNFRILCLTEKPSHTAMWHHYADQYRGVVLELKCDDELCSAWLMARQVTYPCDKPAIYTAEGWANLLTLRQDIAIQRVLEEAIHTKSPDWKYEAEWRVMSVKRQGDSGLYSDYKFHPSEVAGIYLGPKISEEDRSEVISLAMAYPHAKIWNVSIGMSREFHFSQEEGAL